MPCHGAGWAKCRLFPFAGKKLLDEAAAFLAEDAGGHLGAGMEGGGGEAGIAALGVGSADDQLAQLRPGKGSGAHGARL